MLYMFCYACQYSHTTACINYVRHLLNLITKNATANEFQ